MQFKNLFFYAIAFFIGTCTCSCSNYKNSTIIYEMNETGYSIFNTNEKNSDETSVIFFDDDNIPNKDGNNYIRPQRRIPSTIGSSDCYMVKSGVVELLVDGGYQSITSYGSVNDNVEYNDEYVKNECEKNLLRKIADTISSDGILDYLIVTHADYDHLAALIVNGGIFDAFLNHQTITSLNGKNVKLNKINYIIDFDSGLVKNFSDSRIDKSQRLVRSDYYQAYVKKREKLIKQGTSYCPASALFENENIKSSNITITEENKNIAMPQKIINKLEKLSNDNIQYILNEDYDNNINIIKNNSYKNEKIFSSEIGTIKEAKTNNDESRYYYSFHFNSGELRILYNWHYDYIFHSSFNRNDSEQDSTQNQDTQENVYDSQDANNISICFEVINDNFKFLSLGDLGGNGEDGLLKYYNNTTILSNISLFKASHHGSTYNNENSSELFKLSQPSIIVITGCASYKNSNWKSASDDPVVSAMVGRTKLSQTLFNNISKAFFNKKSQPLIMCTNINACRNINGVTYFESIPFYGDIKIMYSKNNLHVSNSYIGSINAYISREWNSNYVQNNKKEFSFSTRNNNEILTLPKTEWYNSIGFNYEGE